MLVHLAAAWQLGFRQRGESREVSADLESAGQTFLAKV